MHPIMTALLKSTGRTMAQIQAYEKAGTFAQAEPYRGPWACPDYMRMKGDLVRRFEAKIKAVKA